jgi:hypothetical protein
MDAAAAGSASRRGEALPDWPQGSVGEDAARRSGGAVGPAAPLAERKHLEAQAEAARLALNAGPTGALFPIVHGPPAPSQPSLAAATSGDDRPSGAAGLARTDSADAASRPAASPTIPTPGAAAPKIESPPAPGERKRGIATLWLDEPGFDEPPRR